MRVRLLNVVLGLTLISTLTSVASAHVELLEPKPRLPAQANGNQVKSKPCGQDANMRTATVTTFRPGETIQVKIKEYVDHPGYFAVAFDGDGDNDFPFPIANMDDVDAATDDPRKTFPLNDKVLGFHLDASAPGGNGNCAANADDTCTISVKLPNIQCQNCTLQVIQFMYDKLNDNFDNEYYYQCADLKLEGELMAGGMGGAGGSGGAGGMAGSSATGGAGNGAGGSATTGGSASGMAGTAAGGAATGGVTASAGAPGVAGTAAATAGTGASAPADASDEGGCAVAPLPAKRGTVLSLLAGLVLGLAGFARRRNRAE